MASWLETKGALPVLLVAAWALVAFVGRSSLPGTEGSLLLALLFGIAVIEGCIAAVAAGTMVKARWVHSVRGALLSVRPLLLLSSFLLLLLIPVLDSYPWAATPGIWLRKDFFLGRNFAFLLLAYVTAEGFAGATGASPERVNRTAVAYLFVFVVSQSLTAYDLVMSLEYPWISTLFGGYFFIEAIYGGFAVAALLYLRIHGRPRAPRNSDDRSDLKDLAILMFGFSILWAGLFFAQFLVIWYGNIPEEVSFLARRVTSSPLREFSIAVLVLLFLVPFSALLATRAKLAPPVVTAASLSILSGILIERYVFLAPAVRVGGAALAIDLLCLLLLFAAVVYRYFRGTSLAG